MGELIRSQDWSKTPLGPIEQWPQNLLANLSAILESPLPQFICWGNGLMMLYNDAYIKLLGDKHVALGKSLLDVWPEAREAIEPMIAKGFAGESVLVESAPFILLRHGYPEETWFDFSFSPLRDPKERVIGLLNTTFEMTKREKKLRESEERSRAIFEQTAVGMAITTPSGRFLRVNKKYNQLTGYTSDELLDLTYKEITHPDDLERDVTKAEQILSGEIQTYTIEKRYISKNGSVVWVNLTCSLVRNYAGEPDYFMAVVEDISERKQAEQRQREIEDKFSRVFEKAPIPTSLSRISDGALVDVNRAWEAMFGVPRSEALGKTPAQLSISVRPEQRSHLYAELEEKGSILNLEVNWYRTKDNPEPILLANLEVMELGGERYVFTTVQDITERKKAEEEIRNLAKYPEQNPHPVLRVSRSGVVLYSNEAGTSLMDYFGIRVGDPLHSEHMTVIKEAFASGQERELEIALTDRVYLLSVAPVAGEEFINLYGLDVTARKKAEEALGESEERHRAFFEASMDAVMLTSPDGSILAANSAAKKMFMMTEAEICAAGRNGLVDISDPRLPSLFDERSRTGRAFGELKMKRGDGSTFEAEISSGVYQDATGKSLSSLVIRDITERKRAEDRLEMENREIALVNRILRVFAETDDEELFDRILEIVLEGLASSHGVFGYISEPGHLICPSLTKMLDACEIEGKCIHYPPGKWKGLWARALVEKRTIYTNKPSRVPAGHPAITNNLAAPILFRGEVIGLLNLANKESDYTQTDRELLEAMAERISALLYVWIQKKLRQDDRTRAEEALRKSESFYRQTLESIPGMVFTRPAGPSPNFWPT
jgi:PAS domain S-box-containing protein